MILRDKVVIVTGVGSGMGRQLCLGAARDGAKVVVASRTAAFVDRVASEIRSDGGEALSVPSDVTRDADCTRITERALSKFGRIDGLVNSAYHHPMFQTLLEADLEDWKKAMDVACFGALRMIRAVLPVMKAQGGGAIVNVGTLTTRKPMPGEAGYAIAKSALSQVTRHMATELGQYNIRVNQALMGWMMGAPLRSYFERASQASGRPVDAFVKEVASRIPLGRIPNDADCAKVVLMLLSDYASEMTGAMVDVNGGEYMPA
jgi:NAD(P)-dependent dehydrogenase (short-subunit alcohol dehydrogenase family)